MAAKGKLRTLEGGRVGFMCPGCKELHQVTVDGEAPNRQGPVWGFNGDYEHPTLTPSIRVRGISAPRGRDEMTTEEEAEYDSIYASGGREAVFASRFGTCCHSFVIDGRIQFLSDCTHELAGQTVDLPNLENSDG